MTDLCITPTGSGKPVLLADFATLTEALDYAAQGVNGLSLYDARGRIVTTTMWEDVREEALATGARLLHRGLQPGDRVGILAETSPTFIATFFGCLYAGLVPCPMPLPAAFGARRAYLDVLRGLLDAASARAIVAPGMFGDWVEEEFAQCDLAFAGAFASLDERVDRLKPQPAAGDGLAYLQFSSGTTRAPMGVAISHRAAMANLRAMATHLQFDDRDRGVSWLPWYHDMGLVGCVLLPISVQMSMDYLATKDFMVRPGLWLDLIGRNRATLSYAPSFAYELAAKRARPSADLDLSDWRVAGIGGDMVRAAALRSFADAFAASGFQPSVFVPSYGMAEATLGLTFGSLGNGAQFDTLDAASLADAGVAREPQPGGRKVDLARCGAVLASHQIEIRDEAGALLPERQVGRVFAAGPSLMQGYFGQPDATAEVLTADGWLDTGDLGYLDRGDLVIAGRAKDMLIVNGRNIWPQDVEWSVESQVDGVRSGGAALIGVNPTPDLLDASELVLVVECRSQEPELREAMRNAAHDVARKIYGLETSVALAPPRSLPRTTSGKLQRVKIGEMLRTGQFDR